MGASTTTVVVQETKPDSPPNQVSWGRTSKAHWANNLGAVGLLTMPMLILLIYWIALDDFDGSITSAICAIATQSPIQTISDHFLRISAEGFLGYAVWISFQALLYSCLPGKLCFGQWTPGGHILSYTTNGLMAWCMTHLLYITASFLGLIDPAVIAKSWQGLFLAANTYGICVSIMAQLKAHLCPNFPEDCKFTGSSVFDLWGGIELNPRIGKHFDLKFFHNSRPGMVAWTLIDLSWAAYQYESLGYVTSSMLIVLVLHTIYVIDFFINEDWYLRTIDINHDHFGFMLAWGDSTFLPTFYTLQAQYLARYPTHLSNIQALAILATGLSGYAIFRLANHEKDFVRSKNGNVSLWGRPATFIQCSYRTTDGKEHQSILLTSGWWGLCRHSNYTADLILSWAMCATCGFSHFLPWSYFFFMFILLNHRTKRDEDRCRSKYGKKWDEYCEAVPYRLIPGVY